MPSDLTNILLREDSRAGTSAAAVAGAAATPAGPATHQTPLPSRQIVYPGAPAATLPSATPVAAQQPQQQQHQPQPQAVGTPVNVNVRPRKKNETPAQTGE